MKTLIYGGTIVNEGRSFRGDLVVTDSLISDLTDGPATGTGYDRYIDATGCVVMPGVIDEHVHFREPGLTHKADIESESRAAAYGGVTSYLEMPNTLPTTTTPEALADKWQRAAKESHVNYGFFYGATNTNASTFGQLDVHRIPGIKLFMGASTGNMLVDRMESLRAVFGMAAQLHLPVMVHCEDSTMIKHNLLAAQEKYGEDPDIRLHPIIRSAKACYASSALAVQLAQEAGAHLHIAHLTTAQELGLLDATAPQAPITGEVCLAHLLFDEDDYDTLGALIKCNPAVKSRADRDTLRKALTDGRISCIATDHAPHELKAKRGGAAKAASGMPMVQFSLVAMLGLVDEGVLTIEKMVELMCHAPARLFHIQQRGFLRKGYRADVVVVRPRQPWVLTADLIQSKCGWSPLLNHQFNWQVSQTLCNGQLIFDRGTFYGDSRGEALLFR